MISELLKRNYASDPVRVWKLKIDRESALVCFSLFYSRSLDERHITYLTYRSSWNSLFLPDHHLANLISLPKTELIMLHAHD
jgi:hypothetical protein